VPPASAQAARTASSSSIRIVTSIGYAGVALVLPHTPPRREATERLAFAKAFRLFRHRSFAVLVAASLPISVIHQIYFMQTAPFFSDVLGLKDSQIGPAMLVGNGAWPHRHGRGRVASRSRPKATGPMPGVRVACGHNYMPTLAESGGGLRQRSLSTDTLRPYKADK
jgi:predicted MFS family arabinose efflux permease